MALDQEYKNIFNCIEVIGSPSFKVDSGIINDEFKDTGELNSYYAELYFRRFSHEIELFYHKNKKVDAILNKLNRAIKSLESFNGELSFKHPVTGEIVHFNEDIPNEVRRIKVIHLKQMVKDIEENKLNKPETLSLAKSNLPKINASIIRRFCELCNNSGLDRKDIEENVIPYCERICLKFKLKYTDNVRQYFDPNNKPKQNDRRLKKVIELILPTLEKSDRVVIDNYIEPK